MRFLPVLFLIVPFCWGFSVNQVEKLQLTCTDCQECCAACESNPECAEFAEVCQSAPKSCKKIIQKFNGCANSGFQPQKCQKEQVLAEVDDILDANGETVDDVSLDMKCFSGDGLVETNKGRMSMAELYELRDRDIQLQSWDRTSGKLSFSPLRFWVHVDPSQETEFLELRTEGGKRIAITGKHFIHRSAGCQGPREAVFAAKVQVGDCLFSAPHFEADKVSGVGSVVKEGIYAPFTESGSVVVDGVAASCFASVDVAEEVQLIVYKLIVRVIDFFQPLLPAMQTSNIASEFPTFFAAATSFKSYILS